MVEDTSTENAVPIAAPAATENAAPAAHSPAPGEVSASTSAEALPEPEYINYDDFAKVQLRAGKVLEAERVPKADKLLRLQVDIGTETRQILAGIAQQFTPEEMVGKTVIVVVNLAPRKLRGFESQGMLLAASDPSDGPPLALITTGAEVPAGAVVR